MARENSNQKADAAAVHKSKGFQELTTVFVLLGVLISLALAGPMSARKIMEMWRQIFSQAHMIPTAMGDTQGLVFFALNNVISILWPVLIAILLGGIAASLIQARGLKISGDRLIPKFSRLNPATGLKRFFSATSLMEPLKSIFKISVIIIIAFIVIKSRFKEILLMTGNNVGRIFAFMGETAMEIMFKVALAMALLVVINFIFQKYANKKKLGITRREVAAAVPAADVVVSNPGNICVAIRYDKNKPAPYVAAKGKGRMAREILAAARRADVAIVEDKSLASVLFKSVEAGRTIPASLYKSVAEILTHGCQLKDKTTV